jgi:hypothetical protein
MLTGLAQKTNAQEIALTYLSPSSSSVRDYKVNLAADVKNTIIVYRRKRVTQKFVNLQADDKGMASLQAALSEAMK